MHLHDLATYSEDPPPLCDWIAELDPLLDCSSAITNAPSTPTQEIYWGVYAAFPAQSSPRLAGVTFGVDYDRSTMVVLGPGSCRAIELHSNEWPAPNTGTAITWNEAQVDRLVHVYVFAGYEYYFTDTSFDLIPHPEGGGIFADDDVPANWDLIADCGRLGFNANPGYLPCPKGDPVPLVETSWGRIKRTYR